MNGIQNIFKNREFIHLAGWLIFFTAPLVLSPPDEFISNIRDTANLESMVVRNLILVGIFYFNLLYLTPVVLKNRGLFLFLLILIGCVILVSVLNWQIHHLLVDRFNPHMERGPMPNLGFGPPRPEPMSIAGPLFSSFITTILVASISTSLVLWDDWRQARAREQEQALQRLASELAVLKLQISPHFLFNTLNNIRWLIRSRSDNAEEAVIKLSQLLRYILYQTDHDSISLEKEIDNLKDYISLQQMRLTGQQSQLFKLTGEPGGKQVIPLLFIPIAENFFKYGDFDNGYPNTISMSLHGDHLRFTTQNQVIKKDPLRKKEESGIGLANIEKRLQLHYPDRHELTYSEKEGVFTLELQILMTA